MKSQAIYQKTGLQEDLKTRDLPTQIAWNNSTGGVGEKSLNIIAYSQESSEKEYIGFIELIGFENTEEVPSCQRDFSSLTSQGFTSKAPIPVWSVYTVFLKEDWRGKGIGSFLYRKAISVLMREYQTSLYLVPWSCFRDGGTSEAASRVWSSLKEQYPIHEGNVLYLRR